MIAVEQSFNVDRLVDSMQAYVQRIHSLDYSPLLEDIGRVAAIGSIDRIKSTKTAPDGTPWDPWSPEYAASGRGDSLLDLTGRLAASIDSFVSGDDEVTIYADEPQAARQHFGFRGRDARGADVDHPARPYLGVSDADLAEIAALMGRFVVEAFA